jgi:MSHA biogenesis protein MshE
MVASSVHTVIAQRLIRVVCESCTTRHAPDGQELEWLRAETGGEPDLQRLARGAGCSHCNGTGFMGRTGVYEMLEMSAPLVHAAHRNDSEAFTRLAREQLRGKTLRDQGIALALAGRTTIAEVMRVAAQTED